MVWLHSPASNSGGDLAVAADTDQGPSLYLWRDGGFQVVAAQGTVTPPGGGEIHWLNPPLAVNGLGQIAAWTGFDQGQGLLLYSQGATVAQSLMISGEAAPGGGDYQQADQVALDGTGRALFQARLSSGISALFLWENGQARKILQTGDEGPSPHFSRGGREGLRRAKIWAEGRNPPRPGSEGLCGAALDRQARLSKSVFFAFPDFRDT